MKICNDDVHVSGGLLWLRFLPLCLERAKNNAFVTIPSLLQACAHTARMTSTHAQMSQMNSLCIGSGLFSPPLSWGVQSSYLLGTLCEHA